MSESDPDPIARTIFPQGASEEEIEETLAVFDSTEIEILTPQEGIDRFPRLSAGPHWEFLTLLGDPESLRATRTVAIVGRREASDQGVQFAHDLAEELGMQSIPTLSGMARGIDQAAHLGSLSLGGYTVAAIPEGILRFLRRSRPHYPSLHSGSSSPLLVVSGAAPWERWSVGQALRRNQWIAGWCDALVVVEANSGGGTWRTTEAALEWDKPIWVCEGFEDRIEDLGNDRLAKTCHANRLDVRRGAKEAVRQVLNESW